MNFVLAVEPDRKQAETLRRIVEPLADVQLVLVTSAYAAVVMINRRVPDLVLVGPSLGQKATEEVLDHFHLASDAPEAQTLSIPVFHDSSDAPQGLFRRGSRPQTMLADPDAFRAEISVCLSRAEQQRQNAVSRTPVVSPIAADALDEPFRAPASELAVATDSLTASAPEAAVVRPDAVQIDAVQADAVQVDGVQIDAAQSEAVSSANAVREDAAVVSQPLEAAREDEEIVLDIDSAPAGDGSIDAEVHFAELAVAHARAEARLAEELERVRNEAAEQRAAELARLQSEADAQRLAEVTAARAAAEADTRTALAAELAKVRNDADQALAEELSRVRAEAGQRLAEQLKEAEQERAAAVEHARGHAEVEAARALESEVARIRSETEDRLAAELRRVHEADHLRRAMEDQAAEQATARALETEVARVRNESDAQLQAALARARQEAEETRQAQLKAQADADARRDMAARQARETAEIENARALEAAVARARREADTRLQQELDRVRADAEFAQLALKQAQIEAAAARDAAAREARAAAEADAAAVHEEELRRVRLAAEARLHEELARVRQESDGERAARARADAMMQAEVALARADADARLAAEVAAVRAESERRRETELAEIRAQLKQAFEVARDDARSTASMTVSAEVARAETTMSQTAASLAARAGKQAASMALHASVVAAKWAVRHGREKTPVVIEFVRDLPPRVLATAATVLLIAGSVAVVGVASLTRPVAPFARSASNTAATLFGVAGHAVQTSLESAKRTEVPAIPVVNRPSPRTKPVKELKPLETGWLAVFSRVPLDLFIAGRRIGSTNDDGHIVLSAGHYTLELVSSEFNYRGQVELDVRAGEVTSHTFTLPTGLLQVETEPGAEIWVEGELAGTAPLGPVAMPIGTRDVVVKHPEHGERRSAVAVRYNEVTTLRLNLGETVRPPQDAFPLPPEARVGPLNP